MAHPSPPAASPQDDAAGGRPALPVPARWFDGRGSQGQAVLAAIAPGPRGPTLTLHPVGQPAAAPERFAHDAVDWPESWNPRRPPPRLVVDLGDRGSLEVAGDAVARWHQALQSEGHRAGIAQRMQTRWPAFIAVLLASVLALVLFYRYGTPWLATQLTRHIPLSWETTLSQETLERMDHGTLKPSRLARERQDQLRARFDALVQGMPASLQRYPGYAPTLRLEFRHGLGANALALPGGTVVMTDGLAETARRNGLGDDALMGVLAHEVGHVVHRHTTRTVVEQGVLNVGLGLALGDVSSLMSMGGAMLTGFAYSRAHEREADCHAIALMAHAGLPTAPMADLLLAVSRDAHEAAEAGTDARDSAKQPPRERASGASAARAAPTDDTGLLALLATHPGTQERAEQLRAGRAPHCARP
ncbi:M48 family metallopeptidase [Acidovorax sp. GBBC 3334]|uniref:M48 family metallopeptidase n=1 Tax=Acidovorax sp. GBBC 3334 TaxID=2940496 RepID=UPI0023028AEB|nr:M48 family metallopeptidase [Acidovorax sp. GBBC 3334]MDA8453889.1 M48 family metallopeptidase [Acidovorax sp. GBBC 3334]